MERTYVGVVGASSAEGRTISVAEEVGRLLAARGVIVVCGGLGGVMEAACVGAKSAGGITVGILPGLDRNEANAWVDIAIPTGLGEARPGSHVAELPGPGGHPPCGSRL